MGINSYENFLQRPKLKIVLDTNILLSSLKKTSSNRPIFDAVRSGQVSLSVTNEILSEYIEIIGEKTTPEIGHNVSQLILNLPKTNKIEVTFRFNLIYEDPDDNKFVDCSIASNAELIVTNDRHFKVLKDVEFPRVETMKDHEFLKLLLEMSK